MDESVSGWPKLLSLAVHEFRTPVTVVAGYLRMLLRGHAGPLEANQRRLIEEADKSCGRLSSLISEMSELGQLLDGRQSITKDTSDIAALLSQVGASMPEGDNLSRVVVADADEPLLVAGDESRLRRVIESMIFALRREIIDGSDLMVNPAKRAKNGGNVAWIAVGTPPVASALRESSADILGPFDDWRGGCGLSLPLARQIVELHGGRLFALRPESVAELTGQPLVRDESGTIIQPRQSGGVLELPLV